MSKIKAPVAFVILFLALGIAILSKNPKNSLVKNQGQLPAENLGLKAASSRIELKHIKPLELNWGKEEGKSLSMKDLRVLQGEVKNPSLDLLEEDSATRKAKKVEFRLRPSEDLYWKFQENNFDVESALKDIDLKKPPVKGEIKISF